MDEKPAEDWFTSCLMEMEAVLALADLDNFGLANESESGYATTSDAQSVSPDEQNAAPLPRHT
jgi:hypothetical protein